MRDYPVENRLREVTELYAAATFFALAALTYLLPKVFLLTTAMSQKLVWGLVFIGSYRGYQGYCIKRYHRRLRRASHFALSTQQIPLSKKWLFIGRGFRWRPLHTQRLHQLKQMSNTAFISRGKGYRWARRFCVRHEKTPIAKLLNLPVFFNPFKPEPDLGGQPYLHGVGDEDKPLFIPQHVRGGHTFVIGTTGVGKTRFASVLINQDIRNQDAVIIVDPKGDLDLLKDIVAACKAADRFHDLKIVHLGFPSLSANYNPLKHFEEISEVATRLTDAIAAEGEGKQFAAFAWKYVNIVATCLHEMQKPINYQSIAFYITRLDQLLSVYADFKCPKDDLTYAASIESLIASHQQRTDKYGKQLKPLERSEAIQLYLQAHISHQIKQGNAEVLSQQILIELYEGAKLDKTYYDKITASIGPVLANINRSNAAAIFSFEERDDDINLLSIIQEKKVLYVGLDSLSNAAVSQAVGKAFLSDLVSTAGKIYKTNPNAHRLNLHCDEISEIVQPSFVKILNKARGAGFQATLYGQTKQDIEVALGSTAMAEVMVGNLNTLIMLRVKNKETAELLVNSLPSVNVISHTEVSTVNDTPHGEAHIFFNTTNEDRVQKTAIPMLEVSDLEALPKGQGFVWVNGGELYKVRMPLPKSDGLVPMGVKAFLQALYEEIKPRPEKPSLDKNPLSKGCIDTSMPDNNLPDQITIDLEEGQLNTFTAWLEKRIQSGDTQFSLASQQLLFINPIYEGRIFLTPSVLEKYERRSGILAIVMKTLLQKRHPETYWIQKANEHPEVFACAVPFTLSGPSTPILKEVPYEHDLPS